MKQKVTPMTKKESEFWENYEDFREVKTHITDENGNELMVLTGKRIQHANEYFYQVTENLDIVEIKYLREKLNNFINQKEKEL